MSKNQHLGFFATVFKHLRRNRLIKQRVKHEIVGTDLHGNTYVLKHADKELEIKEARMVIPSEDTAKMHIDRLGLGVPPEWNSWLQFSRDDPPTLEELERNRLKKLQIQQRVKELAEKERMEKQIESDETSTEITKTISGDTSKVPFPKYDDIQLKAGQMRKPPED